MLCNDTPQSEIYSYDAFPLSEEETPCIDPFPSEPSTTPESRKSFLTILLDGLVRYGDEPEHYKNRGRRFTG
jgi:hypothetical protein